MRGARMRGGAIGVLVGLALAGVLVLLPLATASAAGPGGMPTGRMAAVDPPWAPGGPGAMPRHGPGFGMMHGSMPMPGGVTPGGMPMHGGMMGQRGGVMPMDVGRHFIEEMIPHHEDAVVMAELALVQAEHPELRQLAASIKEVQTAEIEQMRGWYLAWYGTEVGPSMMAGRMGGMAGHNPTAIDGTRPFDKAFVEEMIPHHQMAVMMSSHMLAGVEQPELRALLESIAASQTAEIEQMRRWYRDWYGAEVPATMPAGRGPR